MNDIFAKDIQYVHEQFDLSRLQGRTVLITGATGLIGSLVVRVLLAWNQKSDTPIKVIALVRNAEKAEMLFKGYSSDSLEYIVSDVAEVPVKDMGVDYIIHGASQTASKAFVNEPVEVAMTAINGTQRLLELAKVNPTKSFVYLSSMEVYGTPHNDEKIYENHPTNLITTDVRTCYPESKRMCENLCASYASEYGVPTRIVRLTQTFGTGVSYNDGRVFAEFARCVIEQRDIILKTKGETKRSYLYTADAVTAILTVLLNGETGAAYNAANEETYCSIYDMACLAAKLCSKPIKVIIDESDDVRTLGYAPTLHMNLSTEKLSKLGWKPQYNLSQMYSKMINTMIV